MIGKTIGPYQVLSKLGEGGMGEVYRARDTKLGRDVAIKILPDLWLADPERRARFDREARLLASLNHPHIGAIYGVEDSGDVRALVLELVDGQTLAERLAAGPLPVKDALAMAAQMAEALEAAHERGIVHRDLKPANIKVTPAGRVKVLDFGLATIAGSGPGDAGPDLTQSPTLTAVGTRAGMLLGTAAYMSPEQARGRPVDKRADIWAFGCVLFELLAGRAVFKRDTVTDTLAAIVDRDPDWQMLPPETPPAIGTLLRRALEKDSKRRLRDIGDARLDIEDALNASGQSSETMATARPAPARAARRALWMGIVATLVVAGSIGAWRLAGRRASLAAPAVANVVIPLPAGERLAGDLSSPLIAVSPDGTRIVYAQQRVAGLPERQLYQRTLDGSEFTPIPGTASATHPFFSPDGRWIGFFARGKLRKMLAGGDSSVVLADVNGVTGASWSADGTIVFTDELGTSLSQVSEDGSGRRVIAKPDPAADEASYAWPVVMPDGKSVLLSVRPASGTWDDARVVVRSLTTGEHRVLIQGGAQAQYVASGHLVYARGGSLFAVPFDLARLAVAGPAVKVLDGVLLHRSQTSYATQFAVSESGSVLYLTGSPESEFGRLVWVDRTGKADPLGAPAQPYQWPRLSPDGTRIALTIQAATNDIWMYDIPRQTLSRFTFDTQNDWPVWTPDGKRVVFTSLRNGVRELVSRLADGSGAEQRLVARARAQSATSWSADGQFLVFTEGAQNDASIWALPMAGARTPRQLVQGPYSASQARLSPDARWLAYVSNESGRAEVHVRSFTGSGEKIQISSDGATEPVWSRSGRELFFRSGNKFLSVDVAASGTLAVSKPRVLFEQPYLRVSQRPNYDVAADGRFLMLQAVDEGTAPTHVNVMLNWSEHLKRLVPR